MFMVDDGLSQAESFTDLKHTEQETIAKSRRLGGAGLKLEIKPGEVSHFIIIYICRDRLEIFKLFPNVSFNYIPCNF